ncbi:MAG: GGDEF domain-containing response regulator, partial [Candidatus Methylumidiphilus sp.]
MSENRAPTVLLVDDERSNIRILAEALDENFELVVATNGADALALALSIRPDVILLDVVMPGIDGYEVCAKLKESPETADIPVIFVTAMGDVAAETRGLELGAMDYISKPISPPLVRLRVRNHLEFKKARDALAKLSVTDGLTGLFNRRHFDIVLKGEFLRLSRSSGMLSLILLDVDFFKYFNDTYGALRCDSWVKARVEVVFH